MEDKEKQITIELATLKTVVEFGFKNMIEKLDGILVKISRMEVRMDNIDKITAAHAILIAEGKENRLTWQRASELQAATFATKDQFTPVRMLVYGFTGVLLTGIIIAILTLVLKK